MNFTKEENSLKEIQSILTKSEILAVVLEYSHIYFLSSKYFNQVTRELFFDWQLCLETGKFTENELLKIYLFVKDYYNINLSDWEAFLDPDIDYPNFDSYLIGCLRSDFMRLDIKEKLR